MPLILILIRNVTWAARVLRTPYHHDRNSRQYHRHLT
jgi:hypothetical protein